MKITNINIINGRQIFFSVLLLIVMFALPFQVSAENLFQENPVYVVQSGDTLGTIARRFGVTVEEIQTLNNITDPNALNVGQQLAIPGLEGITGLLTSTKLQYGTTLSGLARQSQMPLEHLITLNHLISPSETIVGTDFIIPIKENQDPFIPLTVVSPDLTGLEAAILSGISPWQLVENNQFRGNWDLVPGDTLFGPAEIAETLKVVEGVKQITINNLPIIQGETLEIHLETDLPVSLSGHFNDRSLNFFTENDSNYYSFLGIHALEEPGIYPLEITAEYSNGTQQSFEQLVLLAEGGYGNEWVNVSEDYLDQEAIEEEDAYLQPILSQVSPVRYWDGRFQYPVDEPCIGSLFGQRRDYNAGIYYFYHTGLDFTVCAQNLNVYAPAAGIVVVSEELFVKGNALIIDHGWGVFSGYWHLSEFNVQVGDVVQPGDLIGIIGNTGRSAGPHLHFEIDILGTPVNPLTWLEQEFP
jgi:murein DD-endopeptidase MepM/ murein hydrolase activator NlpD